MLFYFILGGLFVGLQLYIRNLLTKSGKAKFFPNCVLFLLANTFLALGVGWMYASLMEHEIQAAMIGLVVFGGSGIVIAIAAYRYIFRG